jgi:putative endonuclease
MYCVVYVMERREDRTWYIGFTTNLKERLSAHNTGRSPYTRKGGEWKLIYAELYLNKADALGREKFLKSGAGHGFLKKQLRHYLEEDAHDNTGV